MALEIMPDEAVLQLVMSDGVGDMVGLQELAEHLKAQLDLQQPASGDAADFAARQVMMLVKSKKDAGVSVDGQGEERPSHDDCSVAVAYRAANRPLGKAAPGWPLRTHEG